MSGWTHFDPLLQHQPEALWAVWIRIQCLFLFPMMETQQTLASFPSLSCANSGKETPKPGGEEVVAGMAVPLTHCLLP